MSYLRRVSLFILIIIFSSIGLFATACSSPLSNLQVPTTDNTVTQEDTIQVYYSTEYVLATREEIIDIADIILVGKIISISSTQWNQDNGEYWEEVTTEGEFETSHTALPIYYLEVEVTQLIADNIGLEGKIATFTAVGKSPIDDEITNENSVQIIGSAANNLQVGDTLIIFSRQTELAWHDENTPVTLVKPADSSSPYFKGGTRTVLQFSSAPGFYLLKDANDLYYSPEDTTQEPISLDFLIREIAQRRPIVGIEDN